MKLGAAALSLLTLVQVAHAQMDCSPLDPRAEVNQRSAAELQATADTAFKIAKATGTLKGSAETTILAVPPSASATELSLLQMRSLYLFCGMVANANDLNTQQKFGLYKELLNVQQQVKLKVNDSVANPLVSRSETPSSPPSNPHRYGETSLTPTRDDVLNAGFGKEYCAIPPGASHVQNCYDTKEQCQQQNPHLVPYCVDRPSMMHCVREPRSDHAPMGITCFSETDGCAANENGRAGWKTGPCKAFAL